MKLSSALFAFVFSLIPNAFSDTLRESPMHFSQGWSAADQSSLYHLNEGAEIIPLAWYNALELPQSDGKFSDQMSTYGFIPDSQGSLIGVTVVQDPETAHLYGQTTWVGVNCTACHTSMIEINSHKLIIDGAPSLFDIQKFDRDLLTSLKSTISDQAKFNRFAQRINEKDLNGLKSYLQSFVVEYGGTVARNRLYYDKNKQLLDYGPGRIDGLGGLVNDLSCHLTDRMVDADLAKTATDPRNCEMSQPPVSIPFIWGAPRQQFTQWNDEIHPTLGRNFGASMAGFGKEWIEKADKGLRFRTTVNVDNVAGFEKAYQKLKPPAWEDLVQMGIAPALVPQQVSHGKQIFLQNCNSCHAIQPESVGLNLFGNSFWKVPAIPATEVGTSSDYLDREAARRVYVPEALIAAFKNEYGESSIASDGTVDSYSYRSFFVGGAIIGDLKAEHKSLLEMAAMTNCRENNVVQKTVGYKSRSLEGVIWTAPYLHNGSVPSINELLTKPSLRKETFYLGCRKYDLTNLGYDCDANSENAFLFDTRLETNSNTGHDYGTDLNQGDKHDLMEFMKSLGQPHDPFPVNPFCN